MGAVFLFLLGYLFSVKVDAESSLVSRNSVCGVMMVFWMLLCCFWVANGCSPELSTQLVGRPRLHANPTQTVSSPLSLDSRSNNEQLTDPVQLYCNDFDEKCRWRNMEGLLVDELDWYQGSGFLDEARLRLATGTPVTPDGYYGIAATDKTEFATSKAILVSDPIRCQLGTAEIRFMYWTSPGVRIVVCTKSLERLFPDYDYCAAPFEEGDPGPYYVEIPDLAGQSFQIYIRAENFVYQSANLNGGFAIIDTIEYYGEFCPPNSPNPIGPPNPQFSLLNNDLNEQLVPLSAKNVSRPLAFGSKTVVDFPKSGEPIRQQICEVVNCSFNLTEKCIQRLAGTDWRQSPMPTVDLFGGIPGDATKMPFNNGGSFAFALGPLAKSRFTTAPFQVDENLFLMFAYFTQTQAATLRVYVRRADGSPDQLIFEAPKLALENRRWFREVRPLAPGKYSYIAVEVSNLPLGQSVGVDEFILLDGHKEHYCRPLDG